MLLQTVKELQRELASKSCEVSAAQLELLGWKQQAAVQKLRLVSAQEDLGHQIVHIEALTAECKRRQEECNVAQAQLQAADEHNTQLATRLSHSNAASAKLQVQFTHTVLGTSTDYLYHWTHGSFMQKDAVLHYSIDVAGPAHSNSSCFARQGELGASITG